MPRNIPAAEVKWVRFNPLDFVNKKHLPDVLLGTFYEVNPLGQVRFMRNAKWIMKKPIGEFYKFTVGFKMGHVITCMKSREWLTREYHGA